MRPFPRLAAVMIVASLPLLALSCGGDKKAATPPPSSTTTTSEAPDGSSTTVSPEAPGDTSGGETGSTTVPTDDGATTPGGEGGDVAAKIAAVEAKIEAAKGDFCKAAMLFTSAGDELADPTTPAEVKLYVELTVKMFDTLADSAPSSVAADAATLRQSVQAAAGKVAASGYDPEKLNGEEDLLGAEGQAALQKVTAAFQTECPGG